MSMYILHKCLRQVLVTLVIDFQVIICYNSIVNKNNSFLERMNNMKQYLSNHFLKDARIKSGRTQKQIAQETGYTVEHVNRFENGQRISFPLSAHYCMHILTNETRDEYLSLARLDFSPYSWERYSDEDSRTDYEKQMYSLLTFMEEFQPKIAQRIPSLFTFMKEFQPK